MRLRSLAPNGVQQMQFVVIVFSTLIMLQLTYVSVCVEEKSQNEEHAEPAKQTSAPESVNEIRNAKGSQSDGDNKVLANSNSENGPVNGNHRPRPNGVNSVIASDSDESQVPKKSSTSSVQQQQQKQQPESSQQEVKHHPSGNFTPDNQHHTNESKNISEAFNVKHLIYFENSSQNNGISAVAGPAGHIYTIMEKTEMELGNEIVNKLETLLLNDSQIDQFHPNDSKSDDNGANGQAPATVVEMTRGTAAAADVEVETTTKTATLPSDSVQESVGQVPLDNDAAAASSNNNDTLVLGDDVANPNDGNATEAVAEEKPIPVFSEWAQKQMEEAEKRQEQDVAANSSSNKNRSPAAGLKVNNVKLRAKNYASPDCGAKIIASNQESDNTGHVLSSSKDEYLISVCTSRIWFVVELCEAIQAEKVDLANFELFSSSPKEFSVAVSNRYPTRDWSNVGQFTAKDERNIQSFELNPQLFGKFVRVDIHSHYNKEHFCPVSLFRVYGTSEFEAFETENQPPAAVPNVDYEDDEEEDTLADNGDLRQTSDDGRNKNNNKNNNNNNLFKSASDAVLSIVKKAAQVLTKTDSQGMGQRDAHLGNEECSSLAHLIMCQNCTEQLVREVKELLTCKNAIVDSLLKTKLIGDVVSGTNVCHSVIGSGTEEVPSGPRMVSLRQREFVTKLFPPSYLAAICNLAGIRERRMSSGGTPGRMGEAAAQSASGGDNDDEDGNVGRDPTVNNLTMKEPDLMENEKQIEKETKLPLVDDRKIELRDRDQTATSGSDGKKGEEQGEGEVVQSTLPTEGGTPDVNVENKPPATGTEHMDGTAGAIGVGNAGPIESDDDAVASSNRDQEADSMPPMQKVQGESVFLRLSNRIKALERNMSLSSQYLEELSRRYKRQVEEMQQSFMKASQLSEANNRRTTEQWQQLQVENEQLRHDMGTVLEHFYAWKSILMYLCVFICVQIVLFVLIVLLYIKHRLRQRKLLAASSQRHARRNSTSVHPSTASTVRRNSTEGISCSSRSTTSLNEIRKRPSEEALQIVGTYSELLIDNSCERTADERHKMVPAVANNNRVEKNNVGVVPSKKKNKNQRTRKTSLPNQVFNATTTAVTGKKSSGDHGHAHLQHSQSLVVHSDAKYQQARKRLSGGEATGAVATEDHHQEQQQHYESERGVLLEENDQFYMPGSDLSFNEFMLADHSRVMAVADEELQQQHGQDKKKSNRRLSSPAFFKSALSKRKAKKQAAAAASSGSNSVVVTVNARTVGASRQPPPIAATAASRDEDGISNTSNSSWDWYRLRRQSTDRQRDSESPDIQQVVVSSNGGYLVNGGALNVEGEGEQGGSNSSYTKATNAKAGSFRRIFKKVF